MTTNVPSRAPDWTARYADAGLLPKAARRVGHRPTTAPRLSQGRAPADSWQPLDPGRGSSPPTLAAAHPVRLLPAGHGPCLDPWSLCVNRFRDISRQLVLELESLQGSPVTWSGHKTCDSGQRRDVRGRVCRQRGRAGPRSRLPPRVLVRLFPSLCARRRARTGHRRVVAPRSRQRPGAAHVPLGRSRWPTCCWG